MQEITCEQCQSTIRLVHVGDAIECHKCGHINALKGKSARDDRQDKPTQQKQSGQEIPSSYTKL